MSSETEQTQTLAARSWRMWVVFFLLGLAVAGVLAKLVSLYWTDQAFLQNQGDARSIRTMLIPAHRGLITDRNGEPLAVSAPVANIWADPKLIDLQHPYINRLSQLLDISQDSLIERFGNNAERRFMYLRRQVTPEVAESVRLLGIPGINVDREYRRFYPAGEVTAHLVGFTNVDGDGQEGMELAFDDWLSGESGSKLVMRDRVGRTIRHIRSISDAHQGDELQLSIDLRLQYMAYRELKAVVEAHQADSGSIVILDTQTGEVLAMVNQGSYNPNDRSQLAAENLRNKAITDLFEPGSTMKPLTIAAALESGKYKVNSTVDTSPGYRRFGRFTIRDHRNYGVMDLTEIIVKSSNVGVSKIATDLGGDTLRNLFARMGLGQATGIGFPGEAVGVLPAPPKWRPVEESTLSYGYGVSVNALQLAQAYMVIANGGIRYPVSLMKQDRPPEGQRVLSEGVTLAVRNMLKEAVARGTGGRAQPALYAAGGKTGTVHLVGSQGYEDSMYKAIFAGMAPVDDPRIVTVVAVDAPQSGEYYGGEVAAPVFARVMGDALRLLNVKPELEVTGAKSPRAASGERG